MKCDVDPTKTLGLEFTSDVQYKQIFCEVAQFVQRNNNNNTQGQSVQYLQYPKLYLSSTKPKCNNKQHCRQCHNTNYNTNNSHDTALSLCRTKRKEIANKLFDGGELRQCMTDSLSTTARQLFVPDKLLINDSNKYQLRVNWFVNVYSFLQWQYQVVNVSLHNLVYFNAESSETYEVKDNYNDDEKQVEYVEDNGAEQSVFLFKFDLLTLLHSYLGKLIGYLVLYYCCFDAQSWISVFYPFIEAGIGSIHCKMLFAVSNSSISKQVDPVCGEMLNVNNMMSLKQHMEGRERCLKEMKAVSIFKQLLCNVYERDDNDMNGIKNNPFDLCSIIAAKLQETVLNIKTQRVIRELEMTNHDISTPNTVHDAKIDDNIGIAENNKDMNSFRYKSDVPDFIRLFVIHRIIVNHINNSKQNDAKTNVEDYTNIIEDLTSGAREIVSQLVQDGIKTYMNKWYNEKEQTNIIQTIFDQLILTKFSQQYNEFIKYKQFANAKDANDKSVSYYQSLVFNSTDVMSSIFQYLQYGSRINGLVSCDLVNTCWLHHAYNVNSIYYVNLTNLVQQTLIDDDDNCRLITRAWQRLINIKSIYLVLHKPIKKNAIPLLSDKLAMLRMVYAVNISFSTIDENVYSVLKAIAWKSPEKLNNCRIGNNTQGMTKTPKLEPLTLLNCRHIYIGDSCFYRIWTNKCKTLELNIKPINKDWCNFMISHCDCSKVKYLQLFVTFDEKSINKLILAKFASKFTSIRRLKIFAMDGSAISHGSEKIDQNLLLLCHYLKPMIEKNSCTVELSMDAYKRSDCDYLTKVMVKHDFQIHMLTANVGLLQPPTTKLLNLFHSAKLFAAFSEFIDGEFQPELLLFVTHVIHFQLFLYKYKYIEMIDLTKIKQVGRPGSLTYLMNKNIGSRYKFVSENISIDKNIPRMQLFDDIENKLKMISKTCSNDKRNAVDNYNVHMYLAFYQLYCKTFKTFVEWNDIDIAPYLVNLSSDLRRALTKHYEKVKAINNNGIEQINTDKHIYEISNMPDWHYLWSDLVSAGREINNLLGQVFRRFTSISPSYGSIQKFIQARDDDCLKHLKIGAMGKGLHDLMIQLSLKSINILEFDTHIFGNDHLTDINDLLELKKIIDKKLFVIGVAVVHLLDALSKDQNKSVLSSRFGTLCHNILHLIENQIPIDIKIKIRTTIIGDVATVFNECLAIYSRYLENEIMLKKYKEPKCDSNLKICKPRVKQCIYFVRDDDRDSVVLRAINVEYV